jgi:hypothetical protein
MKRLLSLLLLAAAAASACVNLSGSAPQLLFVVAPILDSVLVGDTLPARSAYLVDASGHQTSAGPIVWSITDSSVATVDASGKIAGLAKGSAVVIATRTDGVRSGAVIIVSRPLELTLLMDTVYMMPSDTFTVPVATRDTAGGSPTLTFDPSPDASRYTIDANGKITGVGSGGAVPYVAHLSDGAATVTDTGAVVVASLTDTSETGRFFMTAFGTAIRHQSGPAIAFNYQRLNGKLAFQLSDTLGDGVTQLERVLITLPDSVIAAGTYEIDSISPQQAETQISQLNPFCQPKFPWAAWYIRPPAQPFTVYSHATPPDSIAGRLIITQYVPVTGGAIISGRYSFQGQRNDLYDDPLGGESVRGTFVAPLRTQLTTCQ